MEYNKPIVPRINKALKGISTDERVLNDILTTHTLDQRGKINKCHRDMFKKDLSEEFHEELGGFFEDVCQAMIMTPARFNTYFAYKIISKYEKNAGMEKCLYDIFLFKSKQDIADMKGLYKLDHDTEMEEDLMR